MTDHDRPTQPPVAVPAVEVTQVEPTPVVAVVPVAVEPRTGSLRWLPLVVIVTGVLSMVLGLIVVDQLGDRTRNVIDITVQGAEVVEAAADPIAGLPADVATLANGVATSLEQVREVAATAGDSASALSVALGTNVASIATGTASVADRVADVLETIERFIPGDTESLAEELRQVSEGLDPVAGQLADLATQLDGAVDELDQATATIQALETQLEVVAERLVTAGEAVQDLPTIATDVRLEAEEARDELEGTLLLFRLLVIVTAVAVVAIGAGLQVLSRQVWALAPVPPAAGRPATGAV